LSWYHDFFHGLPQIAWKAAQTDEQTQLDLELIVDTLDFGPGDRLLDVFCGYGRHALPLARMGAHVTGVDIAPDYIAELHDAARRDKLPVTAIEGDILALPVGDVQAGAGTTGQFDAGYCLGNSFSFFPRPDLQKLLTRLADWLKPGGRLLVHSQMVAESVLPDYQPRNWQPIELGDGSTILFMVENEYDPLAGRIDSHLTYAYGGETQTRIAQHYVYTLADLSQLFRAAGLSIVDVFGTEQGDAYAVGDADAWLIAEKL
jgi:SAM-dependent methyltransferase